MGVSIDTYILVGVNLPFDWDRKSTDDEDSWYDRHEHMMIYEPKPGDFVLLPDYMGGEYCLMGRVIQMDKGKWSGGANFNEGFDAERLSQEIEEVTAIIKDKFPDITEPVKLYFWSHYV